MLIDIYQSGVDANQFVAIPTGHSLVMARLPDEASVADLQLYEQATDLTSGTDLVGVDALAILRQVADAGFVLFRASLR